MTVQPCCASKDAPNHMQLDIAYSQVASVAVEADQSISSMGPGTAVAGLF